MSTTAESFVSTSSSSAASKADWKELVKPFQVSCGKRASLQLVNTIGVYMGLWAAMYFTLGISPWLTYGLAAFAGVMLVRVFIIFHDCGHGSFLPWRAANDIVGFISGMLCFTPYTHWRWEHSLHHASSGNLDRRGIGDVWTMTVDEYLAASSWRRFCYRLSRNPIVLFFIAPALLFWVRERFPSPKASRRHQFSVMAMNLAILALAAGLCFLFGIGTYLLIQLTITVVGGAIGVWMFYVQHQFDEAYWEHGDEWDFATAALQGSSYYRLPKVLQWFTGNIGFHHIHHLSPRIPNYHLQRCHESHALFRDVKPLTIRASLKTMSFHLWDKEQRKLVSFRSLRNRASAV